MITSAKRKLDRMYTERIQPREEKERHRELDRKERDELEKLRAVQQRLRNTNMSDPSTFKHFHV